MSTSKKVFGTFTAKQIQFVNPSTGATRLVDEPVSWWNILDLAWRFRFWPFHAMREQPLRNFGYAGIVLIILVPILYFASAKGTMGYILVLYFLIGLYVTTSLDRVIIYHALSDGWIFSEPDSPVVRHIKKSFKISSDGKMPAKSKYSVKAAVFLVACFLLFSVSQALKHTTGEYVSSENADVNTLPSNDVLENEANSGDPVAQVNLGRVYYAGRGVTKDLGESFKWINMAAQQNDARGEGLVALAYYNGEGVDQDYSQAFQWAQKSADQDDPVGQYALALCYGNGDGVSEDDNMAAEFMKKSAAQGFQPAIDALKSNN